MLLEVCATFEFMCKYPSGVQTNQAVNGVITSFDAFADILESIEHFLHCLRMYTVIYRSMPAVGDIVVESMVDLISRLAQVTRRLKKRRLGESFLASMLCYSS